MARIVILGGGFAGVKCARTLRKLLPVDKHEIILFSRENHLVFHPLLAEVAGAGLQPKDVAAPLRQLLQGIWCRSEEVLNLDLPGSQLEYESHDGSRRIMRFDQLVIACGNDTNLSMIPGMEDHAFPLKKVGDALALQSHIMEQMEKAEVCEDPVKRKWYLSFIIVGGGFSGVEVAGEINDLVRRSLRYFNHIGKEEISVSLIHSRDQILPEVTSDLRDFARRCMEKSGVNLLLNCHAARATPFGVTLNDGTLVAGNTIVCTIGTTSFPLLKRLEVQKVRDRLATNSDMRLPQYGNVWAIGDCAAVTNELDGQLCPPVAQFAERQGTQLAHNIAATINRLPTKPFSYKMMGQMCSIGGQNAVAEVMGIRISGFPAWFLWRGVYLAKLPSLSQQIKVGIQWACDLVFPRTLSYLKTDRSRKVSKAFYAAGDFVIKQGDSGSEFFIIESGEAEVLKGSDANGVSSATFDSASKQDCIAILGPGDFFGEAAVIENRPRNASVRARTNLEVTVLGNNVFAQISSTLNPFRDALLKAARRRTNIWTQLHDMRDVLDSIPLIHVTEPLPLLRIRPDSSVADAVFVINKNRLDFCCVVDKNDSLLGIVSRSDLLRAIEVAASLPEGAEMNLQVSQIMVKNPVSITVNDSTAIAVMTMREHGFKTLPIIDNQQSRVLQGYLRIENIMDNVLRRMLVKDTTGVRPKMRVTKEVQILKR